VLPAGELVIGNLQFTFDLAAMPKIPVVLELVVDTREQFVRREERHVITLD
jgi:hypothetical protein